MSDLTALLDRVNAGAPEAAEQLFQQVYGELRRMAQHQVKDDKFDGALSPTELVHEMYLRVFPENATPEFANRQYFYAAAAQAMRRIRVDQYRATKAAKRGGKHRRVDLESGLFLTTEPQLDLTALDEALTKLADMDAEKARIVELRFFAGLTMSKVADVSGVSLATAERRWKHAKAWLLVELQEKET